MIRMRGLSVLIPYVALTFGLSMGRVVLDRQDAAVHLNLAPAWTEQILVFDLRNSNQ